MARNWISQMRIQTKFLRTDFADLLMKSNNYVFIKLFHCFIASIVCNAFQTCFAEFFPAI